MIALERAREQLQALGLAEAAVALDASLEAASQREIPYAEFLTDLLDTELQIRRRRYLDTRTKLARLPFKKTLEQFDFDAQPSIDRRQIQELATLTFVAHADNLILLGPPGVGKTHLSVALGLLAIHHGSGVYFTTMHCLLEDLRVAHEERRLERRLRIYLAPKLLIIDEFGYLLLDKLGATLLFQLIAARYERGSILLTSNQSFGEWGEVLGDPVIATAILDRLLQHSHVISIRGESYRLREKRKCGLIRTQDEQHPRNQGGPLFNRRTWDNSQPALTLQAAPGLASGHHCSSQDVCRLGTAYYSWVSHVHKSAQRRTCVWFDYGMYGFGERLDFAAANMPRIEDWLRAQPSTTSVENVEDDPEFQRRDIDLLWYQRGCGTPTTVEVKFDSYYHTGNFFIETLSCEERATPGWYYASEADYIFYFFVGNHTLYVFDLDAAREHLEPRLERYKRASTRTALDGGGYYTTVGHLVPIDDVLRCVPGSCRYSL